MTASATPTDPPMAEPGKRPSGGDVGGMRSTADSGIADWAQRASERSDDGGTGCAATGDAAGGAAEPRLDLGGKGVPSSAPGAASSSEPRPAARPAAPPPAGRRAASTGADDAGAQRSDDEEDEWRHEAVAPIDERNPLKSLGKAVSDTVTGSAPPKPAPKR